MMTGSGSALFGLFGAPGADQSRAKSFAGERVFPISLVEPRALPQAVVAALAAAH